MMKMKCSVSNLFAVALLVSAVLFAGCKEEEKNTIQTPNLGGEVVGTYTGTVEFSDPNFKTTDTLRYHGDVTIKVTSTNNSSITVEFVSPEELRVISPFTSYMRSESQNEIVSVKPSVSDIIFNKTANSLDIVVPNSSAPFTLTSTRTSR